MPPRRRHDSLADDEPPTSAGSSSGTRKHQQKKTRFVSPAEDPANFENEIDSALEKPVSMRRKGRVKTEGYESDSSDDGEGVVADGVVVVAGYLVVDELDFAGVQKEPAPFLGSKRVEEALA